MGYKKWDYIEDLTLRTWCDEENCEDLALRLDRTVSSVKSRLQTLGIKKKNVYPKKTWTSEMETYLKSRAGKQSSKSIARNLNVSQKVLRLKASRLGVSLRVHKNRLWTEDEMNLLVAQVSKSSTWEQVSKNMFGRSLHSCRKKAGELGLTLNMKREWNLRELKYIHNNRLMGISYKEIATHLSRTECSVRKRYARYKKEANLD